MPYRDFIERCFKVLKCKLPKPLPDALLAQLEAELTGDEAVAAIDAAAAAAGPIGDLLAAELSYLNDLSDEDFRPDDGATAKESLEKLLTIPDWLKPPLGILNELLKIASGRG